MILFHRRDKERCFMPTANDMSSRRPDLTESLRRDVDELKSDLNSFRADIRGLMRDLVDAGRISASDATHRLGSAVGESVRATREQGRHVADLVEDQIQDRPYLSCGVALALGVAIGSILSHKR
jgi:ElaB/YqjD/DUF883 family membrane-anchored ribosome-binding protein